jgi:hypothetical protein
MRRPWRPAVKSFIGILSMIKKVTGAFRSVELNPVRTGLVRHPGDHPWSSFHVIQ